MAFRPEWNQPSDRYGVAGLLRNLLPLLALYALVPQLAGLSPWLPSLLAPAIGLLLYRLTIVMHDCLHATLFRRRSVNRAVGEALGALCGIDFVAFRRLHLDHHRTYGRPGDPQGFHYLGIGALGRAAFVWHVVRPLLGWNLRDVFTESVLHPANLGRMVRDGRILLVLGVQAAVILTVTGGGRHPWAALLPPLSAATFGLFFSQLRGMVEHGVSNSVLQPGFVRSHAPTLLDRVFLCDLNFNLHEEHHRHPNVPSCHLPMLRDVSGNVAEDGMLRTLAVLAGLRVGRDLANGTGTR